MKTGNIHVPVAPYMEKRSAGTRMLLGNYSNPQIANRPLVPRVPSSSIDLIQVKVITKPNIKVKSVSETTLDTAEEWSAKTVTSAAVTSPTSVSTVAKFASNHKSVNELIFSGVEVATVSAMTIPTTTLTYRSPTSRWLHNPEVVEIDTEFQVGTDDIISLLTVEDMMNFPDLGGEDELKTLF